ncbi:hypothetical protein SESBI_11203 [Sesbania bispinosa]|nr:hypothetical protein SESBI_11203 [Sesbania bispinosa]
MTTSWASMLAITKIVLCENGVIPSLGFSFVKSNEIKDTRGYSNNLFAVSEEMTLSREGRDTRLLVVNEMDKLGVLSSEIWLTLALPRDGLPVMIIKLARVKDEVGIQNLMNAHMESRGYLL